MEKRKSKRVPHRIPCEIETPDGRAVGIVHDVSTNGLFVQTRAHPGSNTILEVCFEAESGSESGAPGYRLEFGVARQRIAPRHLQSVVPTGLGLEIIPPGHDFRRWLDHRLRGASKRPDAAPASSRPPATASAQTFRFRMVRRDSGASRILRIRAASEATARAQALGRLGAGWKISEVSAL